MANSGIPNPGIPKKYMGVSKDCPWKYDGSHIADSVAGTPVPEKSGGKVNYYVVDVVRPHRAKTAYTAECSDIIESLGMDFNEGEAFKAIWRKAAMRQGKVKEGNTALYDAQKVQHFGGRMVAQFEPPIAEVGPRVAINDHLSLEDAQDMMQYFVDHIDGFKNYLNDILFVRETNG